MKEQKTAYQVLNHHLSKFGLTSSVAQEGVLIAAMQEFSDQQNAELRERVKELEGRVSELRTAFANYWVSEGCSCCRDSDSHRDAEHAIGELLGVAKHDDDSGYDFNQYQTIYK